ncbi:MAG TPA: cyclophane-forming radical SAM/SPASM peptide maturase YhhB [Allosphingosinicella sp.]|nr:cyclophane-forming radical SAM/SPASM peptide maturase YhhB [Allosphingosinicella sp.]
MTAARITSFLVKVASRCNLDCDYCYVYHHADQAWRSMPRHLSADDRAAFANRLAEYASEVGLKRAAVIFHGGEPLLAGSDHIVEFARDLRSAVGPDVELEVGMQTNGLLLTDEVLDALEAERISVSLSLDGPRQVNDLHRTTRRGRSSFDKVEAALERLKARPNTFAGVISVIDASVPPATLFEYFSGHAPPKLDFLLPDSHHNQPPPGRDLDPGRYERWLIEAFDIWFDQYPELRVRTFESLLDAIMGLSSGTDAFGLGDVSLITIETDGTYHDLDVLKVVGDGATRLAGSVRDTPISVVASSDAIEAHRRLLSKEGLSPVCQACGIVDICGGGSVPHRFGADGFANPTVYCGEMQSLVAHVRRRLEGGLAGPAAPAPRELDVDLAAYELAERAAPIVAELWDETCQENAADLDKALSEVVGAGLGDQRLHELIDGLSSEEKLILAGNPGLTAWQRAFIAQREGRTVYDVDGAPLSPNVSYLEQVLSRPIATNGLSVGIDDPWLRAPFGASIAFEGPEVAASAAPVVSEALDIIGEWRPALREEIGRICRAVQFVRDPSAHPEKIVSFSDNSVPGALFVSVVQGDRIIDPYDLADSLIHEHRHQKLYLLERRFPMTEPGGLVVSPWREDLRPASGVLHAVFVFIELRRFWEHVRDRGPERLRMRALNQLADTDRNLEEAFATLRGCPLTEVGRALAGVLEGQATHQSLAA